MRLVRTWAGWCGLSCQVGKAEPAQKGGKVQKSFPPKHLIALLPAALTSQRNKGGTAGSEQLFFHCAWLCALICLIQEALPVIAGYVRRAVNTQDGTALGRRSLKLQHLSFHSRFILGDLQRSLGALGVHLGH